MSLRDEKKAETRQAILRAAKKLFQDEGFEETRVHDIALAVHVSDQTVFNYFSSKESVLSQLAVDWYEGTAAWLVEQQRSHDETPDLERFLDSLQGALNWVQGDRPLLRLIVPRALAIHASASASANSTPEEAALVEQFDRNQLVLRGIFESFQKAGALRDDVDPGFIADSYGALFQGALLNWAIRPVSSGEALGDQVVRALRIFLRGLERSGATTRR